MNFAPARLSCFWPGLARAWWRGCFRGLIAASCFSWGLCTLLLATFVWPNWFASWIVSLCWLAMLVYWLIETVRGHWQLGRLSSDAGGLAGDDRFERAQHAYLRGDWFEAEALLHALLAQAPRDAEAQLLLVGVLRHSGRYTAAQRRLSQLELLDTSARWTFEILREKKLLEQRRQSIEAEDEASQPA